MNIFALDASGPCAGAALWQDGEITHEISARHGLTHSQTIMPMTEDILSAAGITPREVDVFACVAGPGSFTGVRIGVCAVRGMAHAAGRKCVSLDALECLAAGVWGYEGVVAPILDARRGQVYCAAFRKGERIREDEAMALEDFVAALPQEKILFVGDGVAVNREKLMNMLGDRAEFAPAHMNFIRASAAAWLAADRLDQAVEAAQLLPIYLRLPQAEREKNART